MLRISRSWIQQSGLAKPRTDGGPGGSSETKGGWTPDWSWVILEVPPILGMAVGMVFWPIWRFSTVFEIYTPTSFSLLLAVACVDVWRQQNNRDDDVIRGYNGTWLLVVAGVAFGAAGSCHHVVAALTLPALCYLVASGRQEAARNIGICAAAALVIGVALYGTMFIIALSDPLWSWGTPNTPQRFWNHVIGKQYSVNLFKATYSDVRRESLRFAWLGLFSLTPTGVVVVVRTLVGISNSWRRMDGLEATGDPLRLHKRFLSLATLPTLGFSYLYIITEDKVCATSS